jgi:hypothetical protein
MIRALSWGCGTQSTALAVMSARGQLEPLDAVITADTGWERAKTYEIREFYTNWLQDRGVRVEIVSAGNIKRDGAIEHIHIPFFTSDGGPLLRQCTRHFKIVPVKRKLRELAGYHPTKPPHPPADTIELWMGISWDEYTRMKHSRVQFIRHRWPLIELKMTRNDSVDYLDGLGLPVPIKSACIGCPYRQASEWLEMQRESPEEWVEVVAFDEQNRHNPLAERGNSTADELFVYKQAVPLKGADLEADAERERRGSQLPLMVCEDGYCLV